MAAFMCHTHNSHISSLKPGAYALKKRPKYAHIYAPKTTKICTKYAPKNPQNMQFHAIKLQNIQIFAKICTKNLFPPVPDDSRHE